MKGKFNAEIEEYNYNKIVGEDFKGKLEFENNELIIVGETSAMEGFFELESCFKLLSGHVSVEQFAWFCVGSCFFYVFPLRRQKNPLYFF